MPAVNGNLHKRWTEESMKETLDGLSDHNVYALLLHLCADTKALVDGKCIHNHIVKNGREQTTLLGNMLVHMYSKCGAVQDAHVLFLNIYEPNVFSWNLIIRAYVGSRYGREAFQLFEQMQLEGVVPNKFVFVSILSLCTSQAAAIKGKWVHTRIIACGFESDVVVRTAIVHMYSKCNNLNYATISFNEMPVKDTVLWNAMITAHAQHVQGEYAFDLFDQMSREGIVPNRATFISILDVCGRHAALGKGKWIHSCIIINELESDVIVQTTLVNMYGKCGSLKCIRSIFDKLHQRDLVLWNAILAVYAQNRKGEEALQLFYQMQGEGIVPDEITFVAILSACASQVALVEGVLTHARLESTSFENNVILGNALVEMYSKCSQLEAAQWAFNKMLTRDVISWNSMLGGFVQCGMIKGALELFHQMQQEGLMPDRITFISLISLSGSLEALAEGKSMHAHITGTGFKTDIIVGTALVNMYGKCSSPEDAQSIFDSMLDCNIYSWNAVIAAFAQKGQLSKAFQLFERMLWEGVMPDKVTFSSILSLCFSQPALAKGKEIHTRIVGGRFDSDVIVGNALINMYCKCGSPGDAWEVFKEMPMQDVVSWNAMIAAYAQNGHSNDAHQLFNQMLYKGILPDKITFSSILSACASQASSAEGRRLHTCIQATGLDVDIVVGNALVTMYGKCNNMHDAYEAFKNLSERDNVTFITILSLCASQTALAEGKQIHAHVIETGCEQHVNVANALMNMYGKCGSLEHAWRLFDKMIQRNVISWNGMIAAYAQNGLGEDACLLFQHMAKMGISPDEATFVSVLSACSHAGLVDEGWYYLQFTKQVCGITPNVDHYNCMIDLLGRAGQIDEACAMIKCMPVRPTMVSWMALLGACRIRVDTEGGEHAAQHVFELGAVSTAPYIILSNIYSEAG